MRIASLLLILPLTAALPQDCGGSCSGNRYCSQGECVPCPVGTLRASGTGTNDISSCRKAPAGQATFDPNCPSLLNGKPCSSTGAKTLPTVNDYYKYSSQYGAGNLKCGVTTDYKLVGFNDAYGNKQYYNGPNFFAKDAGQATCDQCESGKIAAVPESWYKGSPATPPEKSCGNSDGVLANGNQECDSKTSGCSDSNCNSCFCSKREQLPNAADGTDGMTECISCPKISTEAASSLTCVLADGATYECNGYKFKATASGPEGEKSGAIASTANTLCAVSPTGTDKDKCATGWAKDGTTCTQCPAGKYTYFEDCSLDGTTYYDCKKCRDCPAGTTSSAGQFVTKPTDDVKDNQPYESWKTCTYDTCQNGKYCPGASKAMDCPIGTYSPALTFISGDSTKLEKLAPFSGATNCGSGTAAKDTKYCYPEDFVGASSCSTCATGANYAASQCGTVFPAFASCQAGWIPGEKEGECTMCMNGTFAQAGDAVCTQCPDGYFSGSAASGGTSNYNQQGRWFQDLASNAATTCSTCGGGRVYNMSANNCTYCPAGKSLVTWSDPQTFSYEVEVMGKPSRTFSPAPECRPCAPGTFSNATTAQYYQCSPASVGLYQTVQMQENPAPTLNYMSARASCTIVNNWYVDGGACRKCPAGMVSDGVGNTECQPCGSGLVPRWDRLYCVNEQGVMDFFWVFLGLMTCVSMVLFAPCCKARLGGAHSVELGFLGNYRLKTGFICLVVNFILCIIILFAGRFNSMRMYGDWFYFMLFFLLCVPACCGAMYPAPNDPDDMEKQNNPVAS